jgi:enterochelin esterase family protein
MRREGVPRGTVTEHVWKSNVFAATIRRYWVYAPAGHDGEAASGPEAQPAALMVFQDGHAYVAEEGQFRVPAVFDNLIHAGEMPPTIGIFIDPGHNKEALPEAPGWQPQPENRSFEYDTLSDQYARFLLEEILPEVGKTHRLTDDPDRRAICGISSGGISAFTVAWERPGAFRKVLSHVGSFTNIRGGHVYPALIRKGERRPLRVFLQGGENDLDNAHGSWPLANREMAAALRFAGYDHRFVFGEGAHSGVHGGAILPASLRWLWRDQVPFPRPGARVLFLGDSITYAGRYVALIDLHYRAAGRALECLNLGLPSETASGLSEPGHPFPRPHVGERLERVLAKARPDIVVAAYGMNDGIYHPLSEERFAAFRRGIDRLIAAVDGTGARLVLLTPPPFDALPVSAEGKLLPAGKEGYGWQGIFEGYDKVLARYSEWLVGRRGAVEMTIDIRAPIAARLEERRKEDPSFTLAPDGIHLDPEGHALIARAVLEAWGEEPRALAERAAALALERVEVLRDAWLSHTGHSRPGLEEGLPLPEAEARAAALEAEITAALGEAAGGEGASGKGAGGGAKAE